MTEWTSTRTGAAARGIDASMDLLNQIIRQPVDPDYARQAQRGSSEEGPRRFRWALGLTAVLIGAMFAVAALQTTRSAPVLRSERAELISRVTDAENQQDQLRNREGALTADIATLRAAALGQDSTSADLEAQINTLDPIVGNVPVAGPGVSVMVDDAPAADADSRDRVLDIDLQVLANGLWTAGAEAVAINGHRLSGLTAIRSAGDAITVDYRSLTRPYRVDAIGDPRTLHARFVETPAGAWWQDLAQNRRMSYDVSDQRSLQLPADPGIVLRYAHRAVS